MTATSKVHVELAATDPPVKAKKSLPRAEAVPPQAACGNPGSVMPDNIEPKLSVKKTLVAASVGFGLVRVNRVVTVPPGSTGSSMNSFVRVTGAAVDELTLIVSLAAGAATAVPPAVPDNALVVLVAGRMFPAPAGIAIGTVKLQDAPEAGRLPPLKVSNVSPAEPLRVEPVPQTSVSGRPTAVAPATKAAKSSVKDKLVNALDSAVVVIENPTLVVLPAVTESSAKALVKVMFAPPFTFRLPPVPTTENGMGPSTSPVNVPGAWLTRPPEVAETFRVIENVQSPPTIRPLDIVKRAGITEAPPPGSAAGVKLKVLVPPQDPFAGTTVAVLKMSSNSVVNSIFAVPREPELLVIVYS